MIAALQNRRSGTAGTESEHPMANPKDGWAAAQREYESRFGSPASMHWDFQVGEHQLFVVLTTEIQALIEQVWSAELRIAHKWAKLPGLAGTHYLTGLLIEEIMATNQIEGVHSTRKEIIDALENPTTGPHKRFREMTALYQSLLNPQDRPDFPTTSADVRNEYDKLLAGEIKDDDLPDGEFFRAGSVGIHDGMKTVHQAPLGETDIVDRVGVFLTSQSKSSNQLVHALVGHFMFEYTHPFYDGNGRMGRFLLAFKGLEILSPPTSMSLSHQFSLQRKKYYAAFSDVEKGMNFGEATFFLKSMLDMLIDAQKDLESSLDTKHRQLRNLEETLSDLQRDEYQRNLLFLAAQAHLFRPNQPIPLNEAAAAMKRAWNTVRPEAEKLENEGLLRTVSKKPLAYELTRKGREYLGLEVDA